MTTIPGTPTNTQEKLVSGANIKTVGGVPLLGSGDIDVLIFSSGIATRAMSVGDVGGGRISINTVRSVLEGPTGLTVGVNDAGTYEIGDPTLFRTAISAISQSGLNAAIVAIVSANTGRNPLNGEAVTFQSSSGNLIWGAPVYDNSLDFQLPFNSMYVTLFEDI